MNYLEKINQAIIEKGVKRKFIAKELDIKYDTLRRKLKGETEFKMGEISTLCNILKIEITEVLKNEES